MTDRFWDNSHLPPPLRLPPCAHEPDDTREKKRESGIFLLDLYSAKPKCLSLSFFTPFPPAAAAPNDETFCAFDFIDRFGICFFLRIGFRYCCEK